MSLNISYHQKNKFRLISENIYLDLVKAKKEADKKSFNQQLLKIVPEIKKYIRGRLNTAIKKGHFSKEKYKTDDFINQLFIEIYNNIEEVSSEKDFYLWLFKKTNKLLEDTIDEEEFDDYFFKNIDTYSKPEWEAMQEKFSTDGDGDLLMLEELDDSSYNKNDYTLNHVFIENNEEDLIEKLDKDLEEAAINKHIKLVLHNLPLQMRTVFELSTQHYLSVQEISKLQNISIKKVEEILKNTEKALKTSLLHRYNANN